MKKNFLTSLIAIGFFVSTSQLFAQGDQSPWPSGLISNPHETWIAVTGDFDPQTAVPTTLVVEHQLLPSGSYVQDTSFVINDLFFSFTIDGLEPNSNYALRIVCTNTYGEYVWNHTYWTTPVGVGEAEDRKLKLYPNPLQNELFVQNADLGTQITVSNLLGKVILSESIHDATKPERISFEGQPAGVYFVTVTSVGKTISKKVQKK